MNSLLEQQVNQLATLRRELRALETQEQKLTASVRAQMLEHGRTVIRAGSIEARLLEVERLSIPPKKLHGLLSEKEFFCCIAVKVVDARRYVGQSKLRRIGKIERSHQLRLAEREHGPGGAHRSNTQQTAPKVNAR